MNRLPHLAQRLFNVPLAIHPAKLEVIVAAVGERFGRGPMSVVRPQAFDQEGFDDPYAAGPSDSRGYDLAGDVAVIPVSGTLVQKLGTLRPYSGMSGYDGIRQNLMTALTDERVAAIMLDIDSPGGEVAGCFDLVDLIHASRDIKPIWAVLNECAYSAAYAIASAASRITVPRTGGTGSIGVICAHMDMSRALDQGGFTVTLITHGARKADGAPELPLSPEALARFQADIDAMGELFVDTVARNRGLATKAVRDLQAATFLGSLGVEAGLADDVMAPDAAFLALLAERS